MYIMALLSKFQKYVKSHHIIGLLGLLVLVLALSQFSNRKGTTSEMMGNNQWTTSNRIDASNPQQVRESADAAAPAAANPAGQNEVFSTAQGITTTQGLPPSCNQVGTATPQELLPNDQNSAWAKLNPSGAADLNNVNMLSAGFHNGIDTIGSSLRNANLQVRSEPPNPTTKVSPWMNTTIEPDLMRVPLEIGCGPQ